MNTKNKSYFTNRSLIFTLGLFVLVATNSYGADVRIIFAIYDDATSSPANCQYNICFKNGNKWEKELSTAVEVKMEPNEDLSDKLKFIKRNKQGSNSDDYCFRPTFFFDEHSYLHHGTDATKKQAIRDPRFEIWPFTRCKAGEEQCPADHRPFTNANYERKYKKKNKTRLWSADPAMYPYLQSSEHITFQLKIEAKPKKANGKCAKGEPKFVSGDPRVKVVRK